MIAADGRRPFSSLPPEAVRAELAVAGHARYRADQVLRWFYRSPARSFAEMTNLPGPLVGWLEDTYTFSTVTPERTVSADGGETLKYLFQLPDAELLESVCMHYAGTARARERTTVCLSTQVGCAVRCPFCATGQLGLKRNMAAAEVIDQVLEVCRGELARGRRVSQLVYMGMGEPLQNIDATLESVGRFTDPAGLGLGVRRVTVSTSGVVPGIDRLAAAGGGVNLAVSLHSPVDELRDQLVPLNRRWPVAEVIAAARRYARATGRRVSYEYVMLRGVNDSPELATTLGRLLAPELAHVNLIPYNPVPGDPYLSSAPRTIAMFQERVRAQGVECTTRDTRGRRIDAACGQLRAEVTRERAPAGVASPAGT